MSERAYGLTQSRQLLVVREQGLEAERSRRIVFASTGLCSTQIILSDVAEKLVALHAGDLRQQGDEMRLVFVYCAQHIRSSSSACPGGGLFTDFGALRIQANRQRRHTRHAGLSPRAPRCINNSLAATSGF